MKIDNRNIIALEKKINLNSDIKINVTRLNNSNYVLKVCPDYEKDFSDVIGVQFNQIGMYRFLKGVSCVLGERKGDRLQAQYGF